MSNRLNDAHAVWTAERERLEAQRDQARSIVDRLEQENAELRRRYAEVLDREELINTEIVADGDAFLRSLDCLDDLRCPGCGEEDCHGACAHSL